MFIIFNGLYNLISNILYEIVNSINNLFSFIFGEIADPGIMSRIVNLSLFGDNVIFSLELTELITLTTSIIFIVIIIRFLIKSTYNIIKKVFGVFKV